MKKMLSILASLGLTATASSSVAACTSSEKSKKTDWREVEAAAKEAERVKREKLIAEKQVAIKEAMEFHKGLLNQRNELNNKLNSFADVIEQAKQKAIDLDVQKNDLLVSISDAQRILGFENENIGKVNKELEAINKRINELEEKLPNWREDERSSALIIMEENPKKLEYFDKLPEEFLNELKEAEEKLPIKENRLEEVKENIKNVGDEREKLIKLLEEWADERSEYGPGTPEAKEYDVKISEGFKKSKQLRTTINNLRSEKEKLEDEISKLEYFIFNHKTSEGKAEAIKLNKEKNKATIDKLTSELEAAKKTHQKILEEKAQTEDELLSLKSKVEALTDKQNKFSGAIDKLNNEIATHKANYENVLLKIEKNNKIIDHYNQLTNQLEELENKIKEQEFINQALNKDLEELLNKE